MGSYAEKTIYINKETYTIKPEVSINGIESNMDSPIKDGDEVNIKCIEKVLELLEHLDLSCYDTEMNINGKKAALDETISNGDYITYKALEMAKSGSQPSSATGGTSVNVILNGKAEVLQTNKSQFLFVDVFNYINIDVRNVKGTIAMLLNGNKANYTDVIQDGDSIELHWDEK
jgi:hypothetical protein